MRILYFLAHPDGVGGASKVMVKHAHIMQGLGNEVLVVIQSDENGSYSPDYKVLCAEYGVKWCSLHYSVATCMEEIDCMASLIDIPKVEEVIKEFKPDIIHTLQLNLSVETVSRQCGIPNIMSIYPASKDMFNISWPDIYPHYHITDSEYYSKIWQDGLGIISKCIRVPYREKDLEIVPKNNNVIEIVNVAGVEANKRQLEILRFLLICKDNNIPVHMTFIGNDASDYGGECKEYVRKNDLQENVKFTGFVHDVESYLAKADLMIHASISESYPGVIVEAMAYGIPVIATSSGGIPELIVDGENGFLTDGYLSKDIYSAFLRYLKCKEDGGIRAISSNARKTFAENHSFENAGKVLTEYQNEVLGMDHASRDKGVLKATCDNIGNELGSRLEKYASEHTYKRALYLYLINKLCINEQYKTVAIWGTGNLGHIGLEWAKILGLRVMFYIDSKKQGTYEGYDIVQLSADIIDEADILLVSVGKLEVAREIKRELESYGKERNKDFFFVENTPLL